MTRLELLKIVVGRARANGFEFRRWYVGRLGLPWISTDAALAALDSQRRYYALLFNHDFARSFWKPGEEITFAVPAQSFERVMPDGSVVKVNRKPYIRRSARRDAWRYHLREMALAEEPLRYIRRYLHVKDESDEDTDAAAAFAAELPEAADLNDIALPAGEPEAVPPKRASLSATPSGRSSLRNHPVAEAAPEGPGTGRSSARRSKPLMRPLPTGLPAFLRRPPRPQ